jgi:hypothetical protein
MANKRYKIYISNDKRGGFWNRPNDPFRNEVDAYWTPDPLTLPPAMKYTRTHEDTSNLETIFGFGAFELKNYINSGLIPVSSSQFYKIEETFDLESEVGYEIDEYGISALTSRWSESSFRDFLIKLFDVPDWDTSGRAAMGTEGGQTRTFHDETLLTSVPLDNPSSELTDLGSVELLKTDFVYNFLQPNYENFIFNTLTYDYDSSEKSIPNLYGYSLARSMNIYESDPLPYVSKNAMEAMATDTVGEQTEIDIINDGNQIEDAYTNVIFTVDNPEVLSAAPSLLTPFPMYVKMQWPSHKSSKFIGALRASQLADDLIGFLINPPVVLISSTTPVRQAVVSGGIYYDHYHGYEVNPNGDGQTTVSVHIPESGEHTHDIKNWMVQDVTGTISGHESAHTHFLPLAYQQEGFEVMESYTDSSDNVVDPDEPKIRWFDATMPSVDIMAWWDKVRNTSAVGTTSFSDAVIGGYSIAMTDKEPQGSQGTLVDLLKTLIFYGKLKEIVKDNLLSWSDLLKGKTCHSEIVFYRIIKKTDENSSNVIQTIWIPDYPEISMTEYIDTQVVYDKKYYYRIDVFKLVVGSQYTYEHIWNSDNPTKYANYGDPSIVKVGAHLKVTTVPLLKLIECEYGEFDGIIMDSPPVSPNIDIIPYKGVNNKLMFNFNTSTGEYQLTPIVLSDAEQELIDKLRSTKKLPSDSLITYKTDDRVKSFEVFRIETPPKSYDDFKGKLRGVVSTSLNGDTKASSGSGIDMVTSNKVYYYMFRSVDFHGYISNPSPVYKVELVEEDGAIYPLIEVTDGFPQPPTHQISRQFKKLISILPRYTQAQVNYVASNITDEVTGRDLPSLTGKEHDIILGIDDKRLFGQNFKIRLISKKTGRKIDFNLSFETKNLVT